LSALLIYPVWAQTPPQEPVKGLSAHRRAPGLPIGRGAAHESAPVLSPFSLPQPIPMQISVSRPAAAQAAHKEEPAQAHKTFRKIYNPPKINEKEQIRDAWRRAFGCDVWLPYYVAKDIEDKISEKMSVRVFKMKGKPKFEKNAFLYVFRRTF